MSDLRLVFQKNGEKSVADVSPEEYKSIHVMQDDIDALSGKVPEVKHAASAASSSAPVAGNPFLDESASVEPSTDASAKAKSEKGSFLKRFFAKAKASRQETEIGVIRKKRLFIVIGAAVVVILAIIIISAIVFRGNPGTSASVPTVVPSVPTVPVTPPVREAPKQPYSTENPNYLQIDTESATATPDGIVSVLESTSEKVVAMAPSLPVEFLVRDVNNNPIAFSRFAHLLGLVIPDDFLSNLDETFSIYFVPDGTTMRRAVTVTVKDPEKLAVAMKNDEPTLPSAFGPLLYAKGIVVPVSSESRDGSFGSLPTRFAIVDQVSGASFDHVIFSGKFIMATSKASFQSVLGAAVRSQAGNQP
ncbi:MAG TPA: hypothetical protein VN420_00410 [Candidatus Fimivivens sp.]|nr:hypothetical protein [Candidatus Fimivivens sp.]